MFDNDTALTDTKFIGRVCYGKLNEKVRARIEFVTNNTFEQYEGLKTTLINPSDGVIDSSTILFNDFIGPHYGSNEAFKAGAPYLWTYNGKAGWSGAYKPTREDYNKILGLVSDYLDMFRGQTEDLQSGMNMQ
jgi:hypothetical protein